jgi:hypothetical protein
MTMGMKKVERSGRVGKCERAMKGGGGEEWGEG